MINSMAEFESQVLQSEEPTLVDFYAEWCAPCKSLDKVLDTIHDVRIVKVNVHKADAVAGAYMVSMLPTTVMFSGGRVVGALEGLYRREKYMELIHGGDSV